MANCIKILCASVIVCFLCGCFGPVLRIGDKIVPIRYHNGVPFITARSSVFKEIHYSTFGFDWNGQFLLPRQQNSVNYAFWVSKLTAGEKLYSVVCTAERQRHYLAKPDMSSLQKYLESSYRQTPGSKIKVTALKMEHGLFKGLPAINVYMETFEEGRELYLRDEAWYFFDPLQSENFLYELRWNERGRKSDWKFPEAEKVGKDFFKSFKLLPAEK